MKGIGYDCFFTKKIRKEYGNVIDGFKLVKQEEVYPEEFIPASFKDQTFYKYKLDLLEKLIYKRIAIFIRKFLMKI